MEREGIVSIIPQSVNFSGEVIKSIEIVKLFIGSQFFLPIV
jgi:hypothetical protein